MENLYRQYLSQVDVQKLLADTENLFRCESKNTFAGYHESAQRAFEILKETGIPNVERITFPADGKSAFFDCVNPIGWDATTGMLTIQKAEGIPAGFVAADFRKHPFHLIKGSVGTKPGGETVRIISDEQLLTDPDPSDALVLTPPDADGDCGFISSMLDRGIRGFVSDFARNACEKPDGVQWCNGFTEARNWHITAQDRDFIAFSVSPAVGRKLRTAVAAGEVLATMESDGKRFESTVDVVTALIPGKCKEEFWLLAHLYEPLSNDNSSGVAAVIETARLLMKQANRTFSLRLVFGLELYGFCAYVATRSHRAIGAINYDAMYLRNDWNIEFGAAPSATPFYGNILAQLLTEALKDTEEAPPVTFTNSFSRLYRDDTFMTDHTIGIPTVWPLRTGKALWHNSTQTMEYIHPEAFAKGVAFHMAFVSMVLNPSKEWLPLVQKAVLDQLKAEVPRAVGNPRGYLKLRYEILLQDLNDFAHALPEEELAPVKGKLSKVFEELYQGLPENAPLRSFGEYAESVIPERIRAGFPHDLAEIPKSERILLPKGVLYGSLCPVLANMDGIRSLGEILRCMEYETRTLIGDNELADLLETLKYLEKYGYISMIPVKGTTETGCIDYTPAEVRAANVIVQRTAESNGVDLEKAGIPPSLFSQLDGSCSLYDAIKRYEGATGQLLSDEKIGALLQSLRKFEKQGAINVTPKFTFSSADLKNALEDLGLKAGEVVMVHTSLAALGNFPEGAGGVCKALMEILTPDGTLMMPGFNFYNFDATDGVFDPAETPVVVGTVPEFFRKIKGVMRSLHPTHSVCAWGKNAEEFLREHHRYTTMGPKSPLGKLEQADGKVLLISCPDSITFMHVVETSNHVPCLGIRTEEYPVRLPDGRGVKCRTWGWRNGKCPVTINRSGIYNYLRVRGLLQESMFGNAHLMLLKATDYRKARERLMRASSRCATCPIRPRTTGPIVESDWNAETNSVKENSTAFTDEFPPFVAK